jgi:single-strand DNA-binding protein
MNDLNQFTITGRLGADPETRRTQAGKPIVNMRVAVSETWRDNNSGERKEKTEWVSAVIFSEGLCKVAEQYLKKGSKVLLQGKIATRKWQDQSGNDKYSTELVLQGFDAKLIMLDGPSGNSDPKTEKRDSYGNQPANFSNNLSDESPFSPEWR